MDTIELFPSVLTLDDFEQRIYDQDYQKLKSKTPFLIKFYAPWCKHCQSLEKVWNQLQSEDYANFHSLIVDCTAEDSRDLCMQFKVSAYPTIVLLKDNRYYKYRGNREYESLKWFV